MAETLNFPTGAIDPLNLASVQQQVRALGYSIADFGADGIDAVLTPEGAVLIGPANALVTQSDARYRHLINRLDGFVAELRPSGEAIYVNEALAQLLSVNSAELCCFDFFRFFRALDAPDDSNELRCRFLRSPEFKERKTLFSIRGASDRIFSWSSAHVLDSHNRLERLILLGFDVTRQMLAEQELRIAAIAFESQEAMAVTDPDGKILRVNHAFTRITGYSAEDAIGGKISRLKSGRQDHAFYQAMWQELLKTGCWQGELWNRRKSGEFYPVWLTITAVNSSNGKVAQYVGAFQDSTQRKAAADEIERLAFYDPLTHLANRRLMLDRLKHALTSSARRERQGALMLIDLDNFKLLNDTLGHDVGDQLLVEVANRLQTSVRQGDTVARFGGDEFVVILEDIETDERAAAQVEAVAGKIQNALRRVYSLHLAGSENAMCTRDYHCTSSLGITLFADPYIEVDDLLKHADLAMYQAKAAGRNTFRFYDPRMQAALNARSALEVQLRQAIVEQQFVLYYQAQVNAKCDVVGVEALVRWQHPERGLVAPGEFIQLAEEIDQMVPLGGQVMQMACRQLFQWARHPATEALCISVNVSARQFRAANFVRQVANAVKETGANPLRLKLELTESMLIDNVDDVARKMKELKGLGISFSLDDFGTGYSSLAYLKRLPFDQIKLDQSFVRDILSDPNDAAIARTVVALGKSLGLDVIAEGVENEAQREFLASNGCMLYQGYLFSRPVPPNAFEKFIGL